MRERMRFMRDFSHFSEELAHLSSRENRQQHAQAARTGYTEQGHNAGHCNLATTRHAADAIATILHYAGTSAWHRPEA